MLIGRIRELKLWKKKPFYLGGAVFALLVLLCVIRIVIPCREYNYESIHNFDETMEPGWTDIYEGIRLSPGVYHVELEYDTDTDLVSLCNIGDGTVISGGGEDKWRTSVQRPWKDRI